MSVKKVLLLRTVSPDLIGRIFPKSGPIKSHCWNPSPSYGDPIQGMLWGSGDGHEHCITWAPDARWIVLSVPLNKLVHLGGGRFKAPSGRVVYCGDRHGAIQYIRSHGGEREAIVGATVRVGSRQRALVGDHGQAIAGYRGVASSGHHGISYAGNHGVAITRSYGIAIAGDFGRAEAGAFGVAIAGERGTATVSDDGKAQAGNYGKAVAGRGGHAVVGDYGCASTGPEGLAEAGVGGSASAGEGGRIIIAYLDAKRRVRFSAERIKSSQSKSGLAPWTLYMLEKNAFVPARSR